MLDGGGSGGGAQSSSVPERRTKLSAPSFLVPAVVTLAEIVDADHHDGLPRVVDLEGPLRIARLHGLEETVEPEVVEAGSYVELPGSMPHRDVREIGVRRLFAVMRDEKKVMEGSFQGALLPHEVRSREFSGHLGRRGDELLVEQVEKARPRLAPREAPLEEVERAGIHGVAHQEPPGGPRRRQVRSGRSIEANRSEERRVGKECRSRWSPYH